MACCWVSLLLLRRPLPYLCLSIDLASLGGSRDQAGMLVDFTMRLALFVAVRRREEAVGAWRSI